MMQGAKANNFYKEAVLKTLYEMVTHVSAARGLVALINGGQDCASTTVRKLMSQHIYGIIEQNGADRILRLQRDVLDRVIRAVAQLLSDADAGARLGNICTPRGYLFYSLTFSGSLPVPVSNTCPSRMSLMQ